LIFVSWQTDQTLQDLVDVDRAVPVVDNHRLIEVDPAADGREIGRRQTAGAISRGCGRTVTKAALGKRPRPPRIRLTLTRTSFGKPSFGLIHTAIGNPVSRGGSSPSHRPPRRH
jgi:hypothetical protein